MPKVIRSVRGASVARKISGDVMGSLREEKCSPTKASVKPRRSASTMAS